MEYEEQLRAWGKNNCHMEFFVLTGFLRGTCFLPHSGGTSGGRGGPHGVRPWRSMRRGHAPGEAKNRSYPGLPVVSLASEGTDPPWGRRRPGRDKWRMTHARVVCETPPPRLGRTMEHGHFKTNGSGSDGTVSDRSPSNVQWTTAAKRLQMSFAPGVFPSSFGISSVNS